MRKKILVLGGTWFVGRMIVEQLIAADMADITLFNRGKTNADLFPQLRLIRGNREVEADIDPIGREDWDIIIDVSGYFPLSLQTLCNKVKGRVGRYIFISTASVYDLTRLTGGLITEDFALETCSEAEFTDTTMNTYGKRKVACERVLLDTLPNSCLILRPAVIYGPYDPYDRHYYWLYRILKSEKIALPAETESRSMLNSTYVVDLAKAVIHATDLTRNFNAIYNATTHAPLSLHDMVKSMAYSAEMNPEYKIIPIDILNSENIQPWQDMPLWTNADLLSLDNTNLLADLLPTPTPVEDTWRKSLDYYAKLGYPLPKTGISLEQEAKLWG